MAITPEEAKKLQSAFGTPILEKIDYSGVPNIDKQKSLDPTALRSEWAKLPYEARDEMVKNAYKMGGENIIRDYPEDERGWQKFSGLKLDDAFIKNTPKYADTSVSTNPYAGVNVEELKKQYYAEKDPFKRAEIGTKIENAPKERTPYEQVMMVEDAIKTNERLAQQRANEEANGVDYLVRMRANAPTKGSTNVVDEFLKGFARASQQAAGSILGKVEMFSENNPYMTWLNEYAQTLADNVRSSILKTPQLNRAESTKNFAEGGFRDPNYYANVLGSLLPHVAGALTSSVLGGVAAGPTGAAAGALAYSYSMESGSLYNDLLDQGYSMEDARVAADKYGAVAAALDSVVPAKVGGAIANKFTQDLIRQGVKQSAKETFGKMLAEVGKDMFIEGSTEAAQELAQNITKSYFNKNQDIWENVVDSFVGSWMGGGIFGAAEFGVPHNTRTENVPDEMRNYSAENGYQGADMQALSEQKVTPDVSKRLSSIVQSSTTNVDAKRGFAQLEEVENGISAAIRLAELMKSKDPSDTTVQNIQDAAQQELDNVKIQKQLLSNQYEEGTNIAVVSSPEFTMNIAETIDGKFVSSADMHLSNGSEVLTNPTKYETRSEAEIGMINLVQEYISDKLTTENVDHSDVLALQAVNSSLLSLIQKPNPERMVKENRDVMLLAQDMNDFSKFESTVTKNNLLPAGVDIAQFYDRARSEDAKYITAREARNIVDKYAGDIGVKTEFVQKLITPEGKRALGSFMRDERVIKIVTQARESSPDVEITTPYHEVGHAYFQTMMTPEERANVLQEIKNNSKKELTDKEAEEVLVEDLRAYNDKKALKALKKRIQPAYARLLDSIKEIVDKVLKWLGRSSDEKIAQFYEDVLSMKRPSEQTSMKETTISPEDAEFYKTKKYDSVDDFIEEVQREQLGKINEDEIRDLLSLRHDLHSLDEEGQYYTESADFDLLDSYTNIIADIIEKQSLVGNEVSIANKLRNSLNDMRKIDTDFQFDDEYLDLVEQSDNGDIEYSEVQEYEDNYKEEALREIHEEKEKLNDIIENYLDELDQKFYEYELDDISNLREKRNFKPSGYARARSILGTGSDNTARSKSYSDMSKIDELKAFYYQNEESFRESKYDVFKKRLTEMPDDPMGIYDVLSETYPEAIIDSEKGLIDYEKTDIPKVLIEKSTFDNGVSLEELQYQIINEPDQSIPEEVFETLPEGASTYEESKKVGAKRISPDRISHHQLTPEASIDKLAKKMIERDKRNFTAFSEMREKALELQERYGEKMPARTEGNIKKYPTLLQDRKEYVRMKENTLSSDFKSILNALERKIKYWESTPEKEAAIKEGAKKDYIAYVKQDISKGYVFPEAVIKYDPSFTTAVNARERYNKGLRTSFSADDSRIVFSAKETIGVGMKRQDGKELTQDQKDYIERGVLGTGEALGIDMKKIAENERWVYVHLNGKNPFLMKNVAGLYRKDEANDSVSISVGGSERVAIMVDGKKKMQSVDVVISHELGHALDYKVGNKLIPYNVLSQLRATFDRNTQSRDMSYWGSFTEVTARAIEQYVAVKNGDTALFNTGGYWSKENFETLVKPAVEDAIRFHFASYQIEQKNTIDEDVVDTFIEEQESSKEIVDTIVDTQEVENIELKKVDEEMQSEVQSITTDTTTQDIVSLIPQKIIDKAQNEEDTAWTIPEKEDVKKSVDDALYEVSAQLDAAQAGMRIAIDGGTVAINSTFPEWISSENRRKELLMRASEYLDGKFRIPPAHMTRLRSAVLDLYTEVARRSDGAISIQEIEDSFDKVAVKSIKKRLKYAVFATPITAEDLQMVQDISDNVEKYSEVYSVEEANDAITFLKDAYQKERELLSRTGSPFPVEVAQQLQAVEEYALAGIEDSITAETQALARHTPNIDVALLIPSDILRNSQNVDDMVAKAREYNPDLGAKLYEMDRTELERLYASMRNIKTSSPISRLETVSDRLEKNIQAEKTRNDAIVSRLTDARIKMVEMREARAYKQTERNRVRNVARMINLVDRKRIKDLENDVTMSDKQYMKDIYKAQAKGAEAASLETSRIIKQKLRETRKHKELLGKIESLRSRVKASVKTGGRYYVEYARKLLAVFDEYDTSSISNRSMEKLQDIYDMMYNNEKVSDEMKEWYKNNIDRVSKKSLRDMSYDEIVDLYSTLSALANKGAFELAQVQYFSEEEKQRRIMLAIESTKNMDGSGRTGTTRADMSKGAFKEALVRTGLDVLTPVAVMDKFDGNANFHGWNAMQVRSLQKGEQKWYAQLHGATEELKTRIQEIKPTFTAKEETFLSLVARSREEADGAVKNLLAQLGEEIIPSRVEGLTLDQAEQIIDIIEEISDKYEITTQLKTIFESRTNKPFPTKKHYIAPLKYTNRVTDTTDADLEALQNFAEYGTEVGEGMAISRMEKVDLEVRTDLLTLVTEGWNHSLYYINMQPRVDNIQSVVGSKEFKEHAGHIVSRYWKEYLSEVANKGRSLTQGTFDVILRNLRQNFQVAILGFKVSTILTQPTAGFNAAMTAYAMYGTDFALSIMGELAQAYVVPSYTQDALSQSEALTIRAGSAGSTDFAEINKLMETGLADLRGNYSKIKAGAVKAGMYLIQEVDIRTAAAVWNGMYNKFIEKGMSEEKARSEADFFMSLSQSSTQLVDRPLILSRYGEFGRLFFTFQTFSLGLWSMITQGLVVNGIIKGTPKVKIKSALALLAIPFFTSFAGEMISVVTNAIKGKDDDEDLEDKLKNSLENTWVELVATVPLFGSIIKGKVLYNRGYEVPLVGTGTDLIGGIEGMMSPKDYDDFMKNLITVAKSGAIFAGIPGAYQGGDIVNRLVTTEKEKRQIEIRSAARQYIDAKEINLDKYASAVIAKLYTPEEIKKMKPAQKTAIRTGILKEIVRMGDNEDAKNVLKLSKNEEKASYIKSIRDQYSPEDFRKLVQYMKKYKVIGEDTELLIYKK